MSDKHIEEMMGTPPETFDEAVERATDLIIFGADAKIFKESEDYFITMTHHNIGQHIRNYWGLWQMNSGLFRELASNYCLSHADDLSGLILTAVYRRYNDLSLDLDKEAARYHEHWAMMYNNENSGVFTIKL